MELKEQVEIAQDAVRKALVIALESKEDAKAKKLFGILNDIRDIYPYGYYGQTPSSFTINNSPDIISFGGADSGICLG